MVDLKLHPALIGISEPCLLLCCAAPPLYSATFITSRMCSMLAADAIHAALKDLEGKKKGKEAEN